MIRSKILMLSLLVLVLSCGDFAKDHGLPEDMASSIEVEMLDQSTMTEYGRAVMYSSFTLTDPKWAQYIYVYQDLVDPNGSTWEDALSGTQYQDGTVMLTHTKSSNLISQGDYKLRIDVGEGYDVDATYTLTYSIDVDGSGKYLSARIDEHNSIRAPFICEGVAQYDLAVNDASDAIYIRPQDSYSKAQNVALFVYYNSSAQYLLILSANDMQEGKWTVIPESALLPADGARALNAAEMRSGSSSWSFESYASNTSQESWGILMRSELREASMSASEPSSSDVITLSMSRALMNPMSSLTPLAKIKWNER
jgi:hypothetical protein